MCLTTSRLCDFAFSARRRCASEVATSSPAADSRTDYVLSCRLNSSDEGPRGLPRREWIVEAFGR